MSREARLKIYTLGTNSGLYLKQERTLMLNAPDTRDEDYSQCQSVKNSNEIAERTEDMTVG